VESRFDPTSGLPGRESLRPQIRQTRVRRQ
jgi:hypothetical protein